MGTRAWRVAEPTELGNGRSRTTGGVAIYGRVF